MAAIQKCISTSIFLYPLFIFNWLLIRDFKDFFNKKKLVWKVTAIPAVEYVKLFIFKGVFIFYTLILPMLVFHIIFLQIFLKKLCRKQFAVYSIRSAVCTKWRAYNF